VSSKEIEQNACPSFEAGQWLFVRVCEREPIMREPIETFRFESDFAGSLRCIPMAVRFKLDLCGIKLSLRQWSRFEEPERRWLLEQPCKVPADVEAYRMALTEFIARRTGELAKSIDAGEAVAWAASDSVPQVVTSQAASRGVTPPTGAQWCKLTDLQRFALLKLTRPGHDNENFVPAMIEFGILSELEGTL
jgi:hypothetical protein